MLCIGKKTQTGKRCEIELEANVVATVKKVPGIIAHISGNKPSVYMKPGVLITNT